MTFGDALQVYQDFKNTGGKFKTGFYLKRRLDEVFLIVNAGLGDKIIVYRPNIGRRVMTKSYVTSRIRWGDYAPIKEAEAKEVWDKEFEAADISSSEG